MRELTVDNFAGGGGASIGIAQALGRPVDVAINHDPIALAMHKINHPETLHLCEDVWDVDPREVARGRPVGLCWLSPDCTHFSKAKGGRPVKKSIRGLAWVAVRWAATVRPRVIILENVEEFRTWGPLLENNRPCPDRKGKTFKAFVNALKRQGYRVEWRELRACDYGAPTIRKRLFLVARCDGKPIVWPEPTHCEPDRIEVAAGIMEPWRTAAEIIDWSLPCPSIFESAEQIKKRYGVKAVRPLAENTLTRIWEGVQKYVIENPRTFIVKVNHGGGNFRGQGLDEPLQTVTAKHGYGLVAPHITKFRTGATGHAASEPLHTITSGSGSKRPAGSSHALGIVASHLIKYRGTCRDGQLVTEPVPTITAGGLHIGEVRTFLLKYYGTSTGQSVRAPMHTLTTKDRIGLVTVQGQDYQIADIGLRMLQPHELFAAQGFPPDYIIDRDESGKRLPKYQQVALCGNSVPPDLARVLVESNVADDIAEAVNHG